MKTRIEHVTVLTMDGQRSVYPDGYVLEGDRILEAGPAGGLTPDRLRRFLFPLEGTF